MPRREAMDLTLQRRPRNPDDFPAVQLFLLAIVRLAEPIALTSIFPYAWALIKRFEVGDEGDASFYAGLLISSFSLAEALMGMFWGSISDRIGRKPVLLLGCIGTTLSMVMVGFASNIWMALAGRALGGLLNGNIGVIQTMVGELVTKPEHEPRAYSIMPFVWSIGTIVGPVLGGTFADPHDAWPNLFPEGGLFDRLPYLLPNLICAALLSTSILLGYLLLEETHPDFKSQPLFPSDVFQSENTPLIETSDAIKRPAVDLRDDNYGTIRSLNATAQRAWSVVVEKPSQCIFTKRIISVLLALAFFTYHCMAYDHLLPIFFEDERIIDPTKLLNPFHSPGGLGLSMRTVGMIIAVQGTIALFIQLVIFPMAAERIGVYRLFVMVTVIHPIVYVIVPPLLYVPERYMLPAIYICLTIRMVPTILAYPLILILIKDATPTSGVLGRVNGLAASVGAACRMVAPPVAGYLYAVGKKMDCTALAWYGTALVALVGAMQCFSVRQQKALETREDVAASRHVRGRKARAGVRVSVMETFSDSE